MNDPVPQGANVKILRSEPKEAQSVSSCSRSAAGNPGLQDSDRYSLEGWRLIDRSDSAGSYNSDAFLQNWMISDQLGDKYAVICGSKTESDPGQQKLKARKLLSICLDEASHSYESIYAESSDITGGISTEISNSSDTEYVHSPIQVLQRIWGGNAPTSFSSTTSDSQSMTLTERIEDLCPADQLALISLLEMETTSCNTDDEETVDSRYATYCVDRVNWILDNDCLAMTKYNKKGRRKYEKNDDDNDDDKLQTTMDWLVPFIMSNYSSLEDSLTFDDDDLCSTSTDTICNSLPRSGTAVTWWDAKDCKNQEKARDHLLILNDDDDDDFELRIVGRVQTGLRGGNSQSIKLDSTDEETEDEREESTGQVQRISEVSNENREENDIEQNMDHSQDTSNNNSLEESLFEDSRDQVDDISGKSDEKGHSYETEESLDEVQYSSDTNTEDKDGFDTENSLLDFSLDSLDNSTGGEKLKAYKVTFHMTGERSPEKTEGILCEVDVEENQENDDTFTCNDHLPGSVDVGRVLVVDMQQTSHTPLESGTTASSTDKDGHIKVLNREQRYDPRGDKIPNHPGFLMELQQSVRNLFDFPAILSLCNGNKRQKKTVSANTDCGPDPDEKDSRTITLLYSAIRNHDTRGALACIRLYPEECRTWVTCCDTISDEYKLINSPQRLKYLPLHTACLSNSPVCLVKELIRIYPEGVKKRAGNYKYPIHMACDAGVDPDVMCCLIQAWPESIYALDGDNNIPLCSLLLNKPLSSDQDAIMMILLASFQELQEMMY